MSNFILKEKFQADTLAELLKNKVDDEFDEPKFNFFFASPWKGLGEII